jgi:hypothetical protein
MSALEYLTGLTLLATIVGGLWLSARALRAWLVPGWDGAPGLLAGIVLAISVAVVASEALGLLGLLNAPALAIVAVGLAVGLPRLRLTPGAAPAPPSPPIGRLALAIALAVSVLTAVHWAGPVLHSLDVGIYRQDSLWYHLPFAAWFEQTGSIGGLLLTDPLKLTVWYYPLNAELLHAVGMAAFGNDLLSPLLNFGWMGVALLAAWCVGRPFGLAAATLLGGLLVVDSDMMLVQAGNAPSDIAALACLLAAIAILVNSWAARRPPGSGATEGTAFPIDPGPLAVAALAAGLAVGTKVTMLAPVGVITIALLAAAGAGRGKRAAVWLGGVSATGGFWYLRNLVHSGNPLPWIDVGPLPGPSQIDLYPRPAHSIAEYIADRHAWTEYFLPGFGGTLGPLWFVVLFAALAGIALGLRRRHSRLVRAVALAGAATLVGHIFTPISASGPEGGPYGFASNLRYAAPGLAIGLILLPLCESRWMARRVIVPAYFALAVAAAIWSAEWVQPEPAAAIAIGAAAVLAPFWLAREPSGRRRRLVVAGLLAVVVLAGYPEQRRYLEDRYRADIAPPLDNPGFRATDQWRLIQTWAKEQHGMKIGIVGTPAAYGQFVLYGDDLSNEVRYIGEPGPRGGLTPIESCRRWRELVNQSGFDSIVVTPEDPGSAIVPPQIGWTALDGKAISVLRLLPAAVFTLTGPLDPERCRYRPGFGGFAIPGGPHSPGLPPGWLDSGAAGPGGPPPQPGAPPQPGPLPRP